MKKIAKLTLIAMLSGVCGYASANTGAKHKNKTQQSAQLQRLNQSQVKEVQRALSSRGYILSVDGVAGPRTRSAIREFQRDAGITADGTLNAETIDRLNLRENAEFERFPASEPSTKGTHDTMKDDSGMNMNQDSDTGAQPQVDDTDESDQY